MKRAARSVCPEKIDPYQKIAKRYDLLLESFNASLRQIGMRLHPPEKNASVLDVGCGTGSHLHLYENAGCRAFGIDLSPAMLSEAKKKPTRASLLLGDAARMPYSDHSFDLVAAMLALHEMPPETRSDVLGEMARVLKPDGRIVITDYHPGPISFPKGWLYKAVIFVLEMAAGREHFKNFRHFIANRGIFRLLDAHNLELEQIKAVGGGNLGVYVISSKADRDIFHQEFINQRRLHDALETISHPRSIV